jgi:hypothetical protein
VDGREGDEYVAIKAADEFGLRMPVYAEFECRGAFAGVGLKGERKVLLSLKIKPYRMRG